MKSRLIWAAVLLAAAVGFYFVTIRPAMRPDEPPQVNRRKLNRAFKDWKPPEIAPPPLPELVIATPAIPPPSISPPLIAPRNDPVPGPLEVPIQNGATIDFSLGAPMVKMQGKDQEALDRALKEMAEATKDVTFPPPKK